MDWIERVFNIYPDNGDGSLEFHVFLLLFIAVVVLGISTRPSIRNAVRKALLVATRRRPRQKT